MSKNHPANAHLKIKAYRHGLRAGRRNPTVPIEQPRKRWISRHRDEPIRRFLEYWQEGFRDGQMDGGAL